MICRHPFIALDRDDGVSVAGKNPRRQLILNFHGVGPVARAISDQERACWLDQQMFEAVLDLACREPGVRLTVDDGNISDYEIIYPALRARGLTAEFFLCSERMGQPGFLNKAQVREMAEHGMRFGSHGATHRAWRGLTAVQLQVETRESKHDLETLCGIPMSGAACPFGSYDRTVLKALRASGYREVFTSDGGLAKTTDWVKARTTIRSAMKMADIAALIRTGPTVRKRLSVAARQVYKRLR